jgi:hypothetical protein
LPVSKRNALPGGLTLAISCFIPPKGLARVKTQTTDILEGEAMVAWDSVSRDHVLRAIKEYDRLGPERFFSEHGFAPTTTYELAWEERRYPPKAILGTAYEFATSRRLTSGDFEGGKSGAVKVLGELGFTVQEKRRPGK